MNSSQEKDFAPLPAYTGTKTSNASWVNVTVTKTEANGTVTQVLVIVPKGS
ncbi:MAG TPA: hypothetical protein V6C85_39095 [Allocoleopsis sp.]